MPHILKYKYEGDIDALTASDVKLFVNEFLSGSLSPEEKS